MTFHTIHYFRKTYSPLFLSFAASTMEESQRKHPVELYDKLKQLKIPTYLCFPFQFSPLYGSGAKLLHSSMKSMGFSCNELQGLKDTKNKITLDRKLSSKGFTHN